MELKVKLGKFPGRGMDVGMLVEEKDKAYGGISRVTAAMKALYPEGVRPEQIDDFLLSVRTMDKLNRIANIKEAFQEDPWMDVAGYGILGMREPEPEPDKPRVDTNAVGFFYEGPPDDADEEDDDVR